jgi:hypothetical protein
LLLLSCDGNNLAADLFVEPKMSQSRIKNNQRTTKATRTVSQVQKRPVVVFDSADNYSVKDTVLLYRVVFKTKKAVLLALFFCVCFLSQPFNDVYASELDEPVVDTPAEPVVVVEDVEPIIIESAVTETTVVSDDELPAQVAAEPQPELVEPQSEGQTETYTETTTDTGLEGDTMLPPDTESPLDNSSVDTSPILGGVAEQPLTGRESENVQVETASSSDSEPPGVQNLHIVSVVESDSAYSFSKNECTRIEDGSFYCQEREQKEIAEDALIAAPDEDGDLEIYLIRDGEQIQISNNKVDDASPYYDQKSGTLVWHRLINDRYQIISFDPETGEELQLTDGAVNNMEPTRQGEYISWQRWVDDNWEIILYDGQQELQITDSTEHDIAPHIRGAMIIWNSRTNNGDQTLKTYDIVNRTFTTIADSDGVSVSNPRMVVMYEALYENGDVIMKGFDLVTGEIIPLNSIPRDVPDSIPSNDTTGETRALIQSKPTVRDEGVRESNEPLEIPPVPEPETALPTLDLRTDMSSNTGDLSQNPAESIPDLVIPSTAKVNVSTSTQGI